MAPKGHSTRPTADHARQALFNVLEHAPWGPDLSGARVLDGFAGSGALGLEALSRGAAFCLFVDRDRVARDAIAANIENLGCAARSEVLFADMTRLGAISGRTPFDLVFLDPPYGASLAGTVLGVLATGGWLTPGALAIVERGARQGDLVAPGFALLDERAWGKARVSFLRS